MQNALLGVLILIVSRILHAQLVSRVELLLQLARLFAQNAPLDKLGQTQQRSVSRAR